MNVIIGPPENHVAYKRYLLELDLPYDLKGGIYNMDYDQELGTLVETCL
ncbi:MAG TPA: hypothetical protein PLL26_01740 [Candidatus Dojkabacteria bacterium]|nr:hypothetical protein [Candidatus Dojkabacteria bacterium]